MLEMNLGIYGVYADKFKNKKRVLTLKQTRKRIKKVYKIKKTPTTT